MVKKYVCIPHSFLVINVCNQEKTLCSPCRIFYRQNIGLNYVINYEGYVDISQFEFYCLKTVRIKILCGIHSVFCHVYIQSYQRKKLAQGLLNFREERKMLLHEVQLFMHQKLEENNDTNSRLHAARNIKSIYTYTEYAGTNSYLPKKKPTQ